MDSDAPAQAPRTGRQRARVIGVTVVCLLAGVLFGTSAALARHDEVGGPLDLADLIEQRAQQVQELAERADELDAEVEGLRAERASSRTGRIIQEAEQLATGVGLAKVSGPAVAVTLDDAGYSLDTIPEGYSVDDVVVHQQDLQGVINALWAGGA